MLRLAAIPLVLILLLAGSLVWSGEGRQGRADFAYVLKGDHITLDLNNMSYGIDIRVANGLWEGLYMPDPATLEPRLATADRVDVSPDRRVYTFHIRDSARWSNGDKVTSNDFLFEWRRMLENPKEYSYLHTKYIKGAEAYEQAFADHLAKKVPEPDFATVGERAPDPATLQVEVEHPVPFLPDLLAFAPFFPMHERSMEPFKQVNATTGQVTYDPLFTRPPNLVTNGPYRLASWTFKRRIRLERNAFYWDKEHVSCRTIDEIRADDGLAAYRLFQAGDIDWLAAVDTDLAAPLLDRHRPELHLAPAFGTVFYEFNCLPKLPNGQPNPLVDPRVRQALAMSINKQEIVDKIGRLHQPVSSTFIPLGAFRGYTSPAGLPYDVDRARRLLADAGYPQGRGFPRLAILYATEIAANADIATITRRGWKDRLGIDVDPDGMEQKQSAANLNQQKYTICRAGWYGDYLDPSTFTDKYLSGSDNNAAKWADPTYDAICAKAAVEGDPAKRMAYFHDAEERLLDQAPIVPLYTDVTSYLYGDTVHGIVPNPQSLVLFKALSTERSREAH
jgi:oligopeptide transport system substrate-binding protein